MEPTLTIDVRVMTTSDTAAVVQLIHESFSTDEPLCAHLCAKDPIDPRHFHVHDLLDVCMRDAISMIAVRRDSGEVIGCRLSTIETPTFYWRSGASRDRSRHQKAIGKFLRTLDEGVNVFNKYGVGECASFEILTVHRDYRNKGLAKRLVVESEDAARRRGVGVVKVVASNKHVAALYECLGYERLREIRFDEYTDEDGCLVFSDMGDHSGAVLFAKVIG